MFTHHEFTDIRDRIIDNRRRHSACATYIALRPDIHRNITLHFESNGRSWDQRIDSLTCIVSEMDNEFRIEYEAPELGDPNE